MDDKIVISIDAMGGDRGPAAVVGGMALSARKNPDIRFVVHGDEPTLTRLLRKRPWLQDITEIRHTEAVISMDAKPSVAMRRGRNTSMWSTLKSVKQGEATAAVSCGNTGALMAISTLQLRPAPGVDRPAIAVLWPSKNPQKFNIMLDVGADIRADARDLMKYAVMGAEYARAALNLKYPRVGLLNVGTEEHKGRPELHEAAEMMLNAGSLAEFEYVGYVEGGDIPSKKCDVIVSDGFTGNIALKTAEGTAKLVSGFLREALSRTYLTRLGALFSYFPLTSLSKRMDPRRVNGGVFLGLNGAVVKSHGSADATGVSAAIKLAFRLAQNGFSEQVAYRVASQIPEIHQKPAQEK